MDIYRQINEQAKAWSEAQSKLWGDWLAQLQPGQAPASGTEVWKQGVERWESAVNGVLASQSESQRTWAEQVKGFSTTPEEVKGLIDEGVEMTSRFNEVQRGMWEQWFTLLKGGSSSFDPSKLTGEGGVELWRETAERMMKLQSDWLAVMTGGTQASRPGGGAKPKATKASPRG